MEEIRVWDMDSGRSEGLSGLQHRGIKRLKRLKTERNGGSAVQEPFARVGGSLLVALSDRPAGYNVALHATEPGPNPAFLSGRAQLRSVIKCTRNWTHPEAS